MKPQPQDRLGDCERRGRQSRGGAPPSRHPDLDHHAPSTDRPGHAGFGAMGPGLGIAGRWPTAAEDNPGPLQSRQNPLAPRSPLLSPKPRDPPHVSGTLPTSQAPSQPPRAEAEASTGSRSQASRATRGEGEKLPNRRRRGPRRRARGEALGYRQASQPRYTPRSPEALRQVLRRLRAGRSQPGWAWGGGVVTGHRDGGAWRCSAGRGSRCPGSRHARETGGGKARSCLPTRLLQDTPSHCRPLQKATNPTAGISCMS